MHIVTVVVPKEINDALARDKERTGISKSRLVRRILTRYYAKRSKSKRAA